MSTDQSGGNPLSADRPPAPIDGERRLFSFLDSLPVAIIVLEASGKPAFANDLAKRLRGPGIDPTADRSQPQPVYTAFCAGTDNRYPYGRMPIVRALLGETSMVEDMEVERPDGRIQLQVWGAPIRGDNGEVTYAVSAFSNVTAQKRFEHALQESEGRFRTVFEESPLGMAITTPDFRFLQVNQSLCTMTGFAGDELLTLRLTDITHPDEHGIEVEPAETLHTGEFGVLGIEKRYMRKDGSTLWVRMSVRRVSDDYGEAEYFLATMQDVTEQHMAQEQAQFLVYHDGLTGLPNRRLMLDRLGQAVARARRYEHNAILFAIDLDNFKSVNDELGYAAGDTLLVETARRLHTVARDTDTAARLGGDEFLLLITDVSPADGDAIYERLRQSLDATYLCQGAEIFVGASIGRATLGEACTDSDCLMSAANSAMHADKRARRALPHLR
ncbi:MAG: diguanylate cyclase [Chloroflexota bacterium]